MCLTSLRRVRYKPLEIIIVDNGSTDGSQEFLHNNFPNVRLINNNKNYGFAEGNNIGWNAATGDYILFLNNDTVVSPNFLEPLIEDIRKDATIGCIQPQMRVLKQKSLLDTAGSYLTFTGFLYHYGYRKPYDKPMYRMKREVFSAKGACMLIPRNVLRIVGGFDDSFFIFFEETDLCHRIWLAGYTVLYEPRSSIFHVAGGDTTNTYDRAKRIYLTFKNMNYSYLKNFGTEFLLTVYPVFICFQFGLMLYFVITGNIYLVRALIRAWIWNITNIGSMLRKRHQIQHRIRKISDGKLRKHIVYNPGIHYYYFLFFDAKRFEDTQIPSLL